MVLHDIMSIVRNGEEKLSPNDHFVVHFAWNRWTEIKIFRYTNVDLNVKTCIVKRWGYLWQGLVKRCVGKPLGTFPEHENNCVLQESLSIGPHRRIERITLLFNKSASCARYCPLLWRISLQPLQYLFIFARIRKTKFKYFIFLKTQSCEWKFGSAREMQICDAGKTEVK